MYYLSHYSCGVFSDVQCIICLTTHVVSLVKCSVLSVSLIIMCMSLVSDVQCIICLTTHVVSLVKCSVLSVSLLMWCL